MKKLLTLIILLMSTAMVFAQNNGKFTRFQQTYAFNNVTIQHVLEGYEETKNMACRISIDSKRGSVRVEMGNERPRHYLIATRGVTRQLELRNEKVFSFRLSPVLGKGDYMFIKPDWQFVVLMDEGAKRIYIFKNVKGD